MGKTYRSYLGGGTVYRCSSCQSHLALHDALQSKKFNGKHGRAFLFKNAINVAFGPPQQKVLSTGLHLILECFCSVCQNEVGWFYEEAFEDNQKWKEGMVLLERLRLVKENVDV